MTRDSVLARARAFAEAGMTDTCTIQRQTGVTTDDLTGQVTPIYAAIYSGACRIQQAAAMGQRTESGEASVVVLRLELQLPIVGSEGVERGDRVTITAAVNDTALVGRVFTIRDLAHKSEASARRMTLEEVS
jgi:hypothetical protein